MSEIESMSGHDLAAAVAAKRAEAWGETAPEGAADVVEPENSPEPAGEETREAGEPTVDDPAAPSDEPEQPTEEDAAAADAAADAAEDALDEDATDEEVAAARAAAVEEFYVGRYKTREDAERGIEEQKLTIDRQFNELRDLKAKLEQAETAEPLDVEAWKEWATDQVLDGHGEDAAVEALKEGGLEGYEIFMSEWFAHPDEQERAKALVFNNGVMMEMARAAQAPPPPPPEETAKQARAMALARRPDLAEYEDDMSKMVADLDEGTRQHLTDLASQGVEGQARVLDYLYLEVKATRAPKRSAAAQAEARRRRSSGDAAKVAATVTSAEATPTRTPLSAAEREELRIRNERRVAWGQEPVEAD